MIYGIFSAVKRLIASKLKVFDYIIHVCVLCIFMYINTYTCMYYLRKKLCLYLNFIYNINYMNINIYKYFRILFVSVFIYT